jgi:mannitol/fructose-specific phosphotransferase system IIA component (Ntr-type)
MQALRTLQQKVGILIFACVESRKIVDTYYGSGIAFPHAKGVDPINEVERRRPGM